MYVYICVVYVCECMGGDMLSGNDVDIHPLICTRVCRVAFELVLPIMLVSRYVTRA